MVFQVLFEPGKENTSTQWPETEEEFGLPKFTSTQRADKAMKVKINEERSRIWTEPKRTVLVEKPTYQYIYNVHNGDHHRMLVGSDESHEGVLTVEEHLAVHLKGKDTPAGLRVSLEGNIASGKD